MFNQLRKTIQADNLAIPLEIPVIILVLGILTLIQKDHISNNSKNNPSKGKNQ